MGNGFVRFRGFGGYSVGFKYNARSELIGRGFYPVQKVLLDFQKI